MSVALTWPNAGNTLAVTGDFTPILSAYVALDYQESQLIRGDIQSVAPIWQKNLLSLQANSTIVISKDATGAYVAQQLNGFTAEVDDVADSTEEDSTPLWKSLDEGVIRFIKVSFNALAQLRLPTISFSTAVLQRYPHLRRAEALRHRTLPQAHRGQAHRKGLRNQAGNQGNIVAILLPREYCSLLHAPSSLKDWTSASRFTCRTRLAATRPRRRSSVPAR